MIQCLQNKYTAAQPTHMVTLSFALVDKSLHEGSIGSINWLPRPRICSLSRGNGILPTTHSTAEVMDMNLDAVASYIILPLTL